MGVNLHLAASNPSTVTPTVANNTNSVTASTDETLRLEVMSVREELKA
jgi:hypothetical protein